MAKIVYGVAGEGFGHSSRSELIGQHLIEAGHDVLFAASRKSLNYLWPSFNGRVKEVYGLSFHCQNGRVDPLRTVLQNINGYRNGIRINRRLFSEVAHEFKPDLVISDFEPFSAWWAWRHRVPCISIDHEHLLSCCRLETPPGSWKELAMARTVMLGYHTFADAYLILNFFKAPLSNRSAQLISPVVRNAVLQRQPSAGDYILIYSTDASEQTRQHIIDIVSQNRDHRFCIYGFNVAAEEGNCVFKKTSTENFLDDLASCRAVVATAGFSLISECLHFRKPMLLIPVRDQYEQILNAYYVQKLGMGFQTDTLTPLSLTQFLSCLDKFRFDHPQTLLPDNAACFRILEKTIQNLRIDTRLSSADTAVSNHIRRAYNHPAHIIQRPTISKGYVWH